MKYVILEAVKNRRKFAFLPDLSHKLFGVEVMLLSQLSTMLGSALFLECRVGVCNEFFNFVLSKKAFLPTYSAFLRMDILGVLLPRMNNNADIVLCQSFAELHAIRNCLLHEFSSRPFTQDVLLWWILLKKPFRIYKFLNLFCNS